MEACAEDERQVVEDYRKASAEALLGMVRDKPKTGAWVPSCIQHGFTDSNSYNNTDYRVPS